MWERAGEKDGCTLYQCKECKMYCAVAHYPDRPFEEEKLAVKNTMCDCDYKHSFHEQDTNRAMVGQPPLTNEEKRCQMLQVGAFLSKPKGRVVCFDVLNGMVGVDTDEGDRLSVHISKVTPEGPGRLWLSTEAS